MRLQLTSFKVAFKYVVPVIIGGAVYWQAYWFALLYMILFFMSHRMEISNKTLKIKHLFQFSVASYGAAMLPFLPTAIREFSDAPISFAFIFSVVIILFNSIVYFFPLLPFLVQTQGSQKIVLMITVSLLSAFAPNLGNMKPGDVLAQYEFFQPIIRTMGVSLTTFIFWIWCLFMIESWFQKSSFNRKWFLTVLPIIIMAPLLFFDSKINQRSVLNSSIKIMAVQTNFDGAARKYALGKTTVEEDYNHLLTELEKINIIKQSDLYALPEGGFPFILDSPWSKAQALRRKQNFQLSFQDHLKESSGKWILQSSLAQIDPDYSDYLGESTAAVMIDGPSGEIESYSFKKHLVPFLEYIPFYDQFSFLYNLFPWARAIPPKVSSNEVQQIGDLKFKSLICYDSLFADPYFNAIKSGAQIFISLTNNLYLRGGAHYQYAITNSRVVEFGKPLVYVANFTDTGIINGSQSIRISNFEAPQFVQLTFDNRITFTTFYSSVIYPLINLINLELISIFVLFLAILTFLIFRLLKFFKSSVQSGVRRINFKTDVSVFIGLAVATAIYFKFSNSIFQIVYVPSVSMEPTVHAEMRSLVCRFDRDFKRGDIVSSRFGAGNTSYVKRIVLLPGEKLMAGGQILTAEGKVLKVNYERNSTNEECFESIGYDKWRIMCDAMGTLSEFQTDQLQDHEYFILGDNRSKSSDSREHGPVPITNLDGKICYLNF